MTGLADLVAEIKSASRNIEAGDARNAKRLDSIEQSVNDLFKRTSLPGGYADFSDTAERKDAAEMVIAKQSLDVPRFETAEYQPSREQVDEAVMATRGLRQLIRHGDPNKLSAEVRKSLSAFSLGTNSFALSPVQSDRTLSCLVDPSDQVVWSTTRRSAGRRCGF
jgi:hypothetical protein